MNAIVSPTWRGATSWIVSVLLLSLPSMIFVILHVLFAPGKLPGFLDFAVVWTMTLTGILGAVLTVAACVVSVIATFQKLVPRTAKVAMWAFVSFSLIACLYGSQVLP